MVSLKRLSNILKYGVGNDALQKKRADKWKARITRFEDAESWQREEIIARRKYASYDEYLTHQASKLARISDRLETREDRDFAEFKRRFESCTLLSEARSVLCLGARLGTEVKALHSLGYFAVGIDLNPGENNAYVLYGDSQRIVFPNGSADAVYTNCLDHVFDLEQMIGEVRRVLQLGGLFVADLLPGFEEGFVPGEFESMLWRDTQSFIDKIRALGSFKLEVVRDLGKYRRDQWRQAVLRKRA